jgi:hypothetical protein
MISQGGAMAGQMKRSLPSVVISKGLSIGCCQALELRVGPVTVNIVSCRV